MSEELELTPQEKEALKKQRELSENVRKCAAEIAEVLKKYNMRLETTKPEVIVVPNLNA